MCVDLFEVGCYGLLVVFGVVGDDVGEVVDLVVYLY